METINTILSIFEVSIDEIRSTKRLKSLGDVRKIIAYELRNDGLSLLDIGIIMNRHYTSVIFNLQQYEDFLLFDKEFKEKVLLVNKIKDSMKVLLTLDNSKLVVLNNSMQFLDTLNIQEHPKPNRMILSVSFELRTELIQKSIKNRQKDKSFILKLSYHKAAALHQYLQDYSIYFPDSFGSYESNAILQIKNELHRQML